MFKEIVFTIIMLGFALVVLVRYLKKKTSGKCDCSNCSSTGDCLAYKDKDKNKDK